ncbi:fungal-specific transcription factor domain-containing protein [Armillaria novae-zelandiae]|uniref:Fungal-specific transcription factor domain-containing protein n=1 Tax=Armillaria novae-zelandiae TaxID=153914 RepID=A0AA39PG23_9AGAR|nr:fungal-specific transcription factor domain-containing protein [Armillaria novae-zelandiae]
MKTEGPPDFLNTSISPVHDNSLLHFFGRSRERSESSEEQLPEAGSSRRNSRVSFNKASGACVHCKSLKVRCEFTPGETACQRCQAGNYDCVPRTRKKRKPAPTHEDLQTRAINQDHQIQNLLLQFDKLKADNKIRDRMSRAHLEYLAGNPTSDLGVTSKYTHRPDRFEFSFGGDSPTEHILQSFSPVPEQKHDIGHSMPPDIVKYCSLTSDDIRTLFNLFFERINPFFSILDPELHTPESLIWVSPFLFTVICATASRYYRSQPELYYQAQDFARDAAGKALVDGTKSVDVCQAYLIMAVYAAPRKKWEEDRRWLLMGVAIRMALELGLNKPPPPQCNERETMDRTRTWLNCYCADASHAIQFGKIPMISLDDHMAVHSDGWYKASRKNLPFDVHLCAYVQIIVIMARWRKCIGEGNLRQRIRDGFDIVAAAIETEEHLDRELRLWVSRYDEEYSYNPLQICAYRGSTTHMITAYLRLVVLAVGFQHAAKSGLSRDSEVLLRSIDAARSVIQITVERLYPTGHLRYAMEANFVYVSFAAAYLVNLLRAKFLSLLSQEVQEEIIYSVNRLIKVLASDQVALDERHTPALYSRFLAKLMAKNVPHLRSTESGDNHLNSSSFGGGDFQVPPPNEFSWPDRYSDSPPSANAESSDSIPRRTREADMDFSLNNFVRAVSQDIPTTTYDTETWSSWGGSWATQETALYNNWSQFSPGWRH